MIACAASPATGVGGEHDELHAGVLSEPDNRIGVPAVGPELSRECGVLTLGDSGVRLNLLAVIAGILLSLPNAAQHRIESEMNKHPVLAALPFAHGRRTRPGGRSRQLLNSHE